MAKGFGIGTRKNDQPRGKVYLEFLSKVLKVAGNISKLETLYPLLEANEDKLDDKFAQFLSNWGTVKLSDKGATQITEIARSIGNFSNSLLDFPMGNRASNLEIAIAGYQLVLQVFTRWRFPNAWAMTQEILGIAYRDRIHGERSHNIEQAIHCFIESLQVHTRSHFPQQWGDTQNNLGNAYIERIQGERAENIELAIKFFTAALQECDRSLFPQEWSKRQYNLGTAYVQRIQGETANNIEQAIHCFTKALQERKFDRFPVEWAQTQTNLGCAYIARIQGERANNIEKAIYCYTQATKVYTRESFPEQWETLQKNLYRAYNERIQFKAVEQVETKTRFSPDVYVSFIYQLFASLQNSNDDDKVVYPLLQTHQDLLDDNFTQWWRYWVRAELSLLEPEQAENLRLYISSFSLLLIKFPLGNKAINLEIAIAGYEEMLNNFTRSRFPEQWAKTQRMLSVAYSDRIKGERTENLEQAIFHCTEALQVYTREAFPQLWAEANIGLSTIYLWRIQGDKAENLEKAIQYYNQALHIFTRHEFPQAWASTQLNLGYAYFDRIRGDKAENLELAIQYYTEALEEYPQASFPEQWADIKNNLGNAYLYRIKGDSADNIELAIEYLTAALQHRNRWHFPQKWAETQNNLGSAYVKLIEGNQNQNLERAIDHFTNASRVYTHEEYPELWAKFQLSLGAAYTSRIQGNKSKNLQQAIDHFTAASRVYTYQGFPQELAKTQAGLGNAYGQRFLGDNQDNELWEKAVNYYTCALRVLTPSNFPGLCLATASQLGNIGFIVQKWETAIFAYTAAIDAVEQTRTWATSESRRQEILEEAIDVYQQMVQACINAGEIEKAFEYAERSRSKRLVDLMASNDLYQSGEIPSEVKDLLQQYEELQQQIDRERDRTKSDNNRSQTRAAFQAYNEAIASLEAEKHQVWEKLRREDPVLAGEIQVNPLSLSEIQNLIDRTNTAILSFYTTNSDSYIFVVQKNQITLHTCTGQGLATLQGWINQNWLLPYLPREGETKQEKAAREELWYKRMSPILLELAEQLQINELINQHLEGIEELILVPYLLLHQIPFAALPIGNNQYLSDKFLIRYTPSCQILEFCQQRDKIESYDLSYGTVEDATDDLPCASFEGEQLAKLYNIPYSQRLRGSNQATKAKYRQLAEQVQVLHCCHHAQSRLDNPLESSLKLGDGNISLGELMTPGWRLPNLCDVFLSCCETNLGNPSLGDDILTLSTGFLCAGARSVVSTLWAVDDLATAVFCVFYYQHRQQGKSRSEALRQAQISLRSLSKEDVKEISPAAEARERELIKSRKQYSLDTVEYRHWEREYKMYARFNRLIKAIESATEEFPFSHPRYWSAFICQGLR